MVRYRNLISRLGNKENDIKYVHQLLPRDPLVVVEPFGGSFAVIKHFYKDPEEYKFHINDTDERLIYAYLHPEELNDTVNKLNRLYIDEYEGKTWSKDNSFFTYLNNLDINDNLKGYIIQTKFVRGHMFKATKNNNTNPVELNILKNALITKLDYLEIFEQYKNDEDAFLFMDPPYLFTDNSAYASQTIEKYMTKIIVDILKYLPVCKCKVMLVINKLHILSYLFKDYIKGEYTRTYQLTKKTAVHLIICNYDI